MSLPIEAARLFSGAKNIQSPAMNAAGVQVFRSVLARSLYRARATSPDESIRGYVDELDARGVVAIEGFLPPDEFARLKEEADRLVSTGEPVKVHQHGPTQVRQFTLSDLDAEQFPLLRSWPDDGRPLGLAAAAERRRLAPQDGLRVFEHVVHGSEGGHDPETDLHVDTFFSTHKLWLYLDDVEKANAPLVYVPESHKLSVHRLRGDYVESRTANRGARRIDEEELQRQGLSRRLMTAKANTLVVVNTCGYHCRSIGEPGRSRRALHMSFRFNPFFPRSFRADERLTRRNPRVARLLERAGHTA